MATWNWYSGTWEDYDYIRIGGITIKMTYQQVACPYCSSNDIARYGKYKQIQRYWCNSCGHKFVDNDAVFHMRTPKKEISDALNDYYGGKSLNRIREGLYQQYNHEPSESTVYRWIVRFSKLASELARSYKPNVGDTWVADETVLKIGGKKLWFWDIIDSDTRFLLASHISPKRFTKDAQILFERAVERAGKKPKVIVTDKLRSYLDAIELTFGADTKHIATKPFTVETNTNLIERFHGSLKDRTEVMRGLKGKDTARILLDGWLVYYNFFRMHDTLQTTPAKKAGIDSPIKNWLDVVEKEAEVSD